MVKIHNLIKLGFLAVITLTTFHVVKFLIQMNQRATSRNHDTLPIISIENALMQSARKSNLEVIEIVKALTRCKELDMISKTVRRGIYLVQMNYVKATRIFRCSESVTLATHTNFKYLKNLMDIAERWQGPISVAVFAPGKDFDLVLDTIIYMRECEPHPIKELVSFHIYYQFDSRLSRLPTNEDLANYTSKVNCKYYPLSESKLTEASLHNYPMFSARNIAREAALTHFVLTTEIDLVPSTNIPSMFLKMFAEIPESRPSMGIPRIYALQAFEMSRNSLIIPKSKHQLSRLILRQERSRNKNIPWAANTIVTKECPACDKLFSKNSWLAKDNSGPEMEVMDVIKRTGGYSLWEPYYIGPKEVPLWFDNMTFIHFTDTKYSQINVQMYAMCLLDYDFAILSNGFLFRIEGAERPSLDRSVNHKMDLDNTWTKTILPQIKSAIHLYAQVHNMPHRNGEECKLSSEE